MVWRLAAFLLVVATITSRAGATEISFTGLTNQVSGDGPNGVFNVPSSNASVAGSFSYDSAGFSGALNAPSGSTYLAYYVGGLDSVSLTIWDAGGNVTMNAVSAYLELCSGCTDYWSLIANSDQFSFDIQLYSAKSVTFAPGSSPFDLVNHMQSGSQISVLVSNSDPVQTLGFEVTELATSTPEPSSLRLWIFAGGVAGLLLGIGRWSDAVRSRAPDRR